MVKNTIILDCLYSQVLCSLVEITKDIKGVKVEDNKFCISVHYRNVEEKVLVYLSLIISLVPLNQNTFLNSSFCLQNWTLVAQCVDDVIRTYPKLRLTYGRKVHLKSLTFISTKRSFKVLTFVSFFVLKKVLEIRPVIDWDKGKAVTFLLESLGMLK